MKKRILTIVLTAAFLLGGCARGVETTDPPEDDLIVVGISQVGAESDWRVANTESMKAAFTESNGYRLLFEDARQKQENQIIAVRKFIQQKVDYIVLMPLSETGWDSVLQEAREAGIPVILVDRMIRVENETLYTAHIGSDFYAQGEKATAWMAQKYKNQTEPIEIVHIQGTIGSTAQIERTRALEDAVSVHENWNILSQLDGDFTQAKAYEVMNQYLQELPEGQDLDVVYCENDNEAFGAIEALEEFGYVCGETVDVISFDATRHCLELCMEGKISLAVECNPLQGPLAEEIVQLLESGGTPEKYYPVEEQQFTPEMLTPEQIAAREY